MKINFSNFTVLPGHTKTVCFSEKTEKMCFLGVKKRDCLKNVN
ncbi:hypothetical protein CLOLEP_03882 [[Clostridium] leptum DSM 753]|uniref:Uncharacterized protein n=1 Tax=[Clostridium] leptum DSM 753 TaxID=428125 RepID=A7VZ53_9FIRM|nr:hypothetical protein CLOLEP_03882 [[Clostridium] leptum DSM 753]